MRGLVFLPLVAVSIGCTEYGLDHGDNIVTGPQPRIEVEPRDLSWGVKLPNCPSDNKTVTIRNVGESRLTVSELGITGDGSSAYDHFNVVTPLELDVGESAELDISFLAGTTIPYDARLLVRSNAPLEPTVEVTLFGEGGLNPSNEDIFNQPHPSAVDLLWVLDTSCSMSGVVSELETRFNEFITSFVALGLDYRIGATTADMDTAAQGNQGTLLGPVLASATMSEAEIVQGFDDQVDPHASGSATEKVLGAAYAALEDPGHAIADLVRTDANLAVIVVGDEDDQSSRTAAQYVQWMDAYKASPGMTSVSGIIPLATGGGGNIFDMGECIDFMGLPKILNTIDGTGGEQQNLCTLESSFSEIMDWLSYAAAGLSTRFELSSTPATGAAGISVTVNGVSVPFTVFPNEQAGYTYNPSTNQVSFHGSAIPGPGAQIVVTYPVAGECTTN